jgi:hypothetical protein
MDPQCDKSYDIDEDYDNIYIDSDGPKSNIKKNGNSLHEASPTPPKSDDHKNTKFICYYCRNSFTRMDNLNKHIKNRCKVKKSQDAEKEKIFQKLIHQMEEKMDKIIEENKELKNKLNCITNSKTSTTNSGSYNTDNSTNNIQNNTNNTTNNKTINNINSQQIQHNSINLVAFGQEDLSYITDNICKQILNKGFRSVPVLIKYSHFNADKPEQHNVYISNMRDSHAMIYDGKQWKLMDRTEAVDQLIHDKKYYLVEKFEELFEELDPVTIKKFKRFIDFEDDDEILNGLKRDIKYMLYNNKNIPENTRKLLCDNINAKLLEK